MPHAHVQLHSHTRSLRTLPAAGREIRESMFREVADLYHDLDDGMRPISVIFPYLPTAFHRKRDAACAALHAIFKKVITSRRASAAKEDDILQVGGWGGKAAGAEHAACKQATV